MVSLEPFAVAGGEALAPAVALLLAPHAATPVLRAGTRHIAAGGGEAGGVGGASPLGSPTASAVAAPHSKPPPHVGALAEATAAASAAGSRNSGSASDSAHNGSGDGGGHGGGASNTADDLLAFFGGTPAALGGGSSDTARLTRAASDGADLLRCVSCHRAACLRACGMHLTLARAPAWTCWAYRLCETLRQHHRSRLPPPLPRACPPVLVMAWAQAQLRS